MTCRYTLTDADGSKVTLVGKPALKAYLASGGLAHLLPTRAKAAGLSMQAPAAARQTPASRVVSQALADTERFARTIASTWKNAPEIIVAENMNDPRIPQEVRAEDQRQRSGGSRGEPEGFFYRGQVFLINSQLKRPADVARVLFHESLGHYGLRGVFGKALDPILREIVQRRKNDVIAKATSYGLDMADEADLMAAAEEVLAELAQTRPQAGFVQRALAAIRTWLRQNVPGFADLELSDAEIIRDYLEPARAFVQQGAQAGRDMAKPAASRAVAGASWTKARIDRLLKQYAYPSNPKRTKAYAAMIAPEDFLMATATKDMMERLEAENRPLDAQQLAGQIQEIFLEGSLSGDGKTFVTTGHEGRHRMMALRDAGVKQVPVVLYVGPGRDADPLEVGTYIKAQQFNGGEPRGMLGFMPASRLVPINYESAGRLSDEFGGDAAVRFSRAEPQDTGLTPPEPGMLTKVRAAVQDNMNRVKAVQNRIEKLTGEKMPEVENYYGAEANRPGRIAARLEDVRDRMMKPLMGRLAASGYKMPQLSELLHAQHAQERNEAVERINPDVTDGSGMSTEKANEILAKYSGDRELMRIAEQARQIARATLDLKLAYGLIDEDTYTTLTERYERYVPLKGDGEYGPKIKRAMGHDERDEFILENIARDYDQAVVVGEKNLARQSLLAMTLENPDANLWSVGVPPRGRYVAGQIYSVQKNGKQEATFTSLAQVTAFLEAKGAAASQYEVIDSGGERVQSFVKPLQENEVPVYLDGKLVRIQIYDEALARQLRPLDQGRMNPILEGMRSMTRYLSKIYTGYNPYFILRNLARDLLTGTINITGNEGATMLARAWANYPQAFAALGQWAATKKLPQNEAGKYLAEYRAHGGKTGASWMSDLEQQAQNLQRLFDDAYGVRGYAREGRLGKAAMVGGRKTVAGLAHVIEIANQATENSLRLALYMAMRKQGVNASVAARAAKTVTVDFDRKGSMTGALGAIYLFFNPAVQGTANALRTLAKGEHREQAWMALGALALLGFYAAGAGLDDDKDRWLGESWDSRSKTLILKAGDYQIRVPLSLEFAPFYALGVAIAEASRGATSNVAAAGHMMTSFLNAYFPLNGVYDYDSDNHAMDAAQAFVPTVIKPGFEIAANRNAFGSQIVPENEFTKNKPDNLKMYRTTKNTTFDTAAQSISTIGEIFGAGKYENDLSKVSPETLRYLWRTYTGGLGTFVTDTISTGRLKAEGAELEAGEIPFVKDFVRNNDVRAIRSRYYQLADEAKAAASEFAQAKKAGDDAELDKILADPKKSPIIGLDNLIRKTSQAAAKIRDEEVEINADQTLSAPEKRAKLKELEKQEEELYRSAIEAFK